MGLTGFRLFGAVKGLGFGVCLSATLSVSACASSGLLGAEKLAAVAEASSCTNPVILKHVLKGATKASLSANDIPQVERTARVRVMGFKTATPVSGSGCAEPGITKYQLAGTDDAPTTPLYVKHMTKAQIKADPNIRCKPTYTQVYQPPLKLGGAGRVIMVPNGERCERVNFELAPYEYYPSPWSYIEHIAKEPNQVVRVLSLDNLKKNHPKWSELLQFSSLSPGLWDDTRRIPMNDHSRVFSYSKECAGKSDCAAIQHLIRKRRISCEEVDKVFAEVIKKEPKNQFPTPRATKDILAPVKLNYLSVSSGDFGCVSHYLLRQWPDPRSSPTYYYFGEAIIRDSAQEVSFLCNAFSRGPRCFFKRGSLSDTINLME